MTISKDKTKELISEHGKSADDSGSPESQISIFSERILPLSSIIFTFFKFHFKEDISADSASIRFVKLLYWSNS